MSTAEIFDRGYRTFDGERAGLGQAMRSVAWHTTRSILGIGRKGRHKVFPIIVAVIAFLPSIAFLALAVLIGDLLEGELQPEYWELFGLPIVAVTVFATLVAPEAIVRDRRDGMLRLYLSTPLTAPTYLTAKFVAVMTSMAIVVAGLTALPRREHDPGLAPTGSPTGLRSPPSCCCPPGSSWCSSLPSASVPPASPIAEHSPASRCWPHSSACRSS